MCKSFCNSIGALLVIVCLLGIGFLAGNVNRQPQAQPRVSAVVQTPMPVVESIPTDPYYPTQLAATKPLPPMPYSAPVETARYESPRVFVQQPPAIETPLFTVPPMAEPVPVIDAPAEPKPPKLVDAPAPIPSPEPSGLSRLLSSSPPPLADGEPPVNGSINDLLDHLEKVRAKINEQNAAVAVTKTQIREQLHEQKARLAALGLITEKVPAKPPAAKVESTDIDRWLTSLGGQLVLKAQLVKTEQTLVELIKQRVKVQDEQLKQLDAE